MLPILDDRVPVNSPLVAVMSPVNLTFEAVNCPLALTLNWLADIINSSPIDDDIIKLELEILLAPIVNPPIEPLSVLMWVDSIPPVNKPLVAVMSPVIFTFEAVNCPLALTLNWLADIISPSPVDDDIIKSELDINVSAILNPPIEPLSAFICVASKEPANEPPVAVILPVKSTLEAVNCPLALTLNWLADIINSSPIDDDIIKLELEILLAPIVNPPIEPLSVLMWVDSIPPVNKPLVAVMSPVIFTFEAVNCPSTLTLNLLADITKSLAVVDDERTKLALDILLSSIVNPPIEPLFAFKEIAVILPLKFTFDALTLPAWSTLKLLELINVVWDPSFISTSPGTDSEWSSSVNPPIVPPINLTCEPVICPVEPVTWNSLPIEFNPSDLISKSPILPVVAFIPPSKNAEPEA